MSILILIFANTIHIYVGFTGHRISFTVYITKRRFEEHVIKRPLKWLRLKCKPMQTTTNFNKPEQTSTNLNKHQQTSTNFNKL